MIPFDFVVLAFFQYRLVFIFPCQIILPIFVAILQDLVELESFIIHAQIIHPKVNLKAITSVPQLEL